MSIKNIILVASGKGGVGKSTITTEIAKSLTKQNFRVGILDADIHGPNIPNLFNLKNIEVKSEDNLILPVESSGIKIMSVGFLADENAPLMWRGAMLSKMLQELLQNTKWDDLDYLMIDLPPGSGDIHITLAQKFPITGVILVSTPSHLALSDLHRSVNMFANLSIPTIGLVENMSYLLCENCQSPHYIFKSPETETLYKNIGIDIMAKLPVITNSDNQEYHEKIDLITEKVISFKNPKQEKQIAST